MRNVIGRENLITCGRTNELAHAVRTEDSRDSFMADRMGLESWAGPGNEATTRPLSRFFGRGLGTRLGLHVVT